MMISPESYYEEIKAKPTEEIQEEIDSLSEEIEYLKLKLEEIHRITDPIERMAADPIKPDTETHLIMNRKYLKMAKKALKEAGGK